MMVGVDVIALSSNTKETPYRQKVTHTQICELDKAIVMNNAGPRFDNVSMDHTDDRILDT